VTGRHEARWVPDTAPAGYQGRHRATFPAGTMLAAGLAPAYAAAGLVCCVRCEHSTGCQGCYCHEDDPPRCHGLEAPKRGRDDDEGDDYGHPF
jgi:hypothetical protein